MLARAHWRCSCEPSCYNLALKNGRILLGISHLQLRLKFYHHTQYNLSLSSSAAFFRRCRKEALLPCIDYHVLYFANEDLQPFQQKSILCKNFSNLYRISGLFGPRDLVWLVASTLTASKNAAVARLFPSVANDSFSFSSQKTTNAVLLFCPGWVSHFFR